MATYNIGRVAYVNKGAYNAATVYEDHDVVLYQNGSYTYINGTPASGNVPTNATYWKVMLDPTAMNAAIEIANNAGTYIGPEEPESPLRTIWLDTNEPDLMSDLNATQALLNGAVGSAEAAQTAAEAARDLAEGYRDNASSSATDAAASALQVATQLAGPAGSYATLVALEAAYPTGDAGAYLVEADSHLYFWDSTDWADAGVFAPIQASNIEITDTAEHYATANVEGALAEIGQRVSGIINVLAYGVTGDGVTDDTTALQAAITAAAGKVLQLPREGTLLVTAQITIAASMTIDGNGATILSGLTAPGSAIGYTPLIYVTDDNVTIRDLTIDCGTNNHVGIEAYGTDGFVLENCHVLNAGEKASFWVQGSTNATIRDCSATGNNKAEIDTGARLAAFYVAKSNHVTVDNCRVLNWYGKAFLALADSATPENYYDVWFTRCRVDGSGLDGPAGAETVLNTPRSESNGFTLSYYMTDSGVRDCHVYDVDMGVKISYAAERCIIDGCTFVDCRNYAVLLQGCADCVVSNCNIDYSVGTVEGDVIPYYGHAASIEQHVATGTLPSDLGSFRNRIVNCTFDMTANTEVTSDAVYIKQTNSENSSIEGCNFVNCQRGANINAPATKVIGNTFTGCAGSSVLLRNAPGYSIISQNVFQDPAGYAIECAMASQTGYISICNNTVADGLSNGILLKMLTYSECSGNKLKHVNSGTDTGIKIEADVDYTIINNNITYYYAGYGINHTDTGSAGLVMMGNIAHYATGGIVFAAASGKCIGNQCVTSGAVAVAAKPLVESYGNGVAGAGITVITPDGNETWRIAVDNDGVVTSIPVT